MLHRHIKEVFFWSINLFSGPMFSWYNGYEHFVSLCYGQRTTSKEPDPGECSQQIYKNPVATNEQRLTLR